MDGRASYENPDVISFLQSVQKLMIEQCLQKGSTKSTKIIDYKDPDELEKILKLDIGEEPVGDEQLLVACQTTIDYSVKTVHPHFFNQLYSSVNPYGLAGAWLTDALNTNCHVYEVAPVFLLMESYLMKKMCGIIGFPNGEGVFGPGGAYLNIMAANVARYHQNRQVLEEGFFGQRRLMLFASDLAHYSIQSMAAFLGFGTNSVVRVPTDEKGRMIPSELERKIQETKNQGNIPLYVQATTGTTVFGAFDQLNPIADVCEKHNVWLHADCCWGSASLMSKKRRHLVAGMNRADSVSLNMHKAHGVPLQCSMFIIKNKELLVGCNSLDVEYLYQPDKMTDLSYDRGNLTVQCGRKVDSFKFWLMWKALGDKGMEDVVEKAYDNVGYLTEKLRITEGFRLVIPEFEYLNVCFWYIPSRLRGQPETKEWWEDLGKVTAKIKERMIREGTLMISYQPITVKGLVNFFRIIIRSPNIGETEMDFVIEEIQRLGQNL